MAPTHHSSIQILHSVVDQSELGEAIRER